MTWAVLTKRNGEGRYTLSILDETGRDVTSTAAPLVAAAPDLLEALKELMGDVSAESTESLKKRHALGYWPTYIPMLLRARAAIAKAEGREP